MIDPLSQVPMAILQSWLSEALAAYQALMTGQNAVQVTDANGSKATYTASDKNALRAYTLRLQAIVNPSPNPAPGVWGGPANIAPCFGNPCGNPPGGPLRFIF